MFTLTKEFRFEASHQLVDHDGKCSRLHGHSWKGRVIVSGGRVSSDAPKRNMLVDFGDLKKLIDPIVEQFLDHHHLNETLRCEAPTSEFIASWIFCSLERDIKLLAVRLVAVEIDETCTSSCRYEL